MQEERVLNAFAILYEDVLPVRFGGDILFNLLDKSIVQARSQRHDFLKSIVHPAASSMDISSSPSFSTSSSNPSASSAPTSSSLNNVSPLKKRIISKIMAVSVAEDESQCAASVLFPQLDVNKDGAICLDEFQEWVESVIIEDADDTSSWEDADLKSVYNDIDNDADGSITLEEFKMWTTGVLDSPNLEGMI